MSLNRDKLFSMVERNFTKMPNRLLELTRKHDIKGAAFHVLVTLLLYSDDWHPSIRTLKKSTGLGRTAIENALKNLVESKILSCEGPSDYGQNAFAFNVAIFEPYLGQRDVHKINTGYAQNQRKARSKPTHIEEEREQKDFHLQDIPDFKPDQTLLDLVSNTYGHALKTKQQDFITIN